jgi:hypothetical protein
MQHITRDIAGRLRRQVCDLDWQKCGWQTLIGMIALFSHHRASVTRSSAGYVVRSAFEQDAILPAVVMADVSEAIEPEG